MHWAVDPRRDLKLEEVRGVTRGYGGLDVFMCVCVCVCPCVLQPTDLTDRCKLLCGIEYLLKVT